MLQLTTMLGPAVHHGKDKTQKTLEITCNARAWPQCWKSSAIGSNIVALRFGDHGTTEMLGVVGLEVDRSQTLRNNSQQHATGCANGCNM